MVKRLQILAALALLTASPAQGELPTYTCVKTVAAPRIDGRGDDPVWAASAAATMVDVSNLSGRRQHAHPTQVRMLWDEEQLYVLFIATDPDAWSTLADRDDRLWNEEVVEFYADPDGDGPNTSRSRSTCSIPSSTCCCPNPGARTAAVISTGAPSSLPPTAAAAGGRSRPGRVERRRPPL